MQVSHETIYSRSMCREAVKLRRNSLSAAFGCAKRRSQGIKQTHGKLRDMVMISELRLRPTIAHYPVNGKATSSSARTVAVRGTLVERSTRFVLLLHSEGPQCRDRRRRDAKGIRTLPVNSCAASPGIRREMTNHRSISVARAQIFFCDPTHPGARFEREHQRTASR